MLASVIGNVAKQAANVATTSMVQAPRPPLKVWCVTLRRVPAQTEEDEPEIGGCEKAWLKSCLLPCALVAYFFGTCFHMIIYFIACTLCPCVGPTVFVAFAQARLKAYASRAEGGGAQAGVQEAKRDAQRVTCVARTLVSSYIWVVLHMNRPLMDLWNW
mmetsp:Transcript_11834/g.31229  ORF Transcript_11834/g.31229 Transcript_11834/m.31229 type:complete len:159 (-) Transcript_11834:9-485(-)